MVAKNTLFVVEELLDTTLQAEIMSLPTPRNNDGERSKNSRDAIGRGS